MHLSRILICYFLASLIQSATAHAHRAATPEPSRTDQAITPTTTAWITNELLLINRQTALPATRPALTTTFTPSAGCLSEIYLDVLRAGGPYATLGPSETSDCFPVGWRPDITARFSPGVCPSGYTVACSTAETIEYLSETTATCCPSGYACFDEGALFYGKACSSAIVALTTISAQAFVSSAFVPTAWIAGRYCWGGGDSVNARGVGILWQSTDFYGISPPPTTTTGLGSTMSTGSCISATTMATVDAPAAPDTTTGELAIGDKISIGLGLGVGIPSLLFAAWGVLYARKSYQLKIAKQEVGHNPATAGAVLLEGLSVGIISETDGQERLIDDIREVAGRNKNPTTETKECSNNKRNPKVND